MPLLMISNMLNNLANSINVRNKKNIRLKRILPIETHITIAKSRVKTILNIKKWSMIDSEKDIKIARVVEH